MNDSVGIRELRQHASEIVRELEQGKTFSLTVQGRFVGELQLQRRSPWVTWEQVRDIFAAPTDPTWADDLDIIGDDLADPWERT